MNNINGFILNINPNQIVDRDDYIDRIISIIQKPLESNIIIIMSESAVGKTSLVDKLLNKAFLTQDVIRIKTLPLNTSEKLEEWEYLLNIFDAICKKYKHTSNSFESYIYSLKNKSNNKILLEYILGILYNDESLSSKKKFFLSFFYVSVLWFFKLKKFDIERLINDNSIKAKRIKTQYIKNIFQNNKIILSIDNIQNIDQQSLREFINLINETKDNCPQILFEYTITETTTRDDCQDLGKNLEATSAKTHIIQLEKIGKEYIVDVVSKHMLSANTNWEFNIKLQEEYAKNDTGNIREMIDYSICFDNKKNSISTERQHYTLENIVGLPECAKQLFSILICANNSIDFTFLNKITTEMELDVNGAISSLKERLLIEEHEEQIVLSHASLADVWFNHPNQFDKFDNISYVCLENRYLEIINNPYNEKKARFEQAWLNLIQLYSKKRPENLISLFRYIDVDCKNSISGENAWKYINNIIKVTENDIDKNFDLYMDIIRYCFESELYNEGYSVVLKVIDEKNTNLLVLYKAMYLSALDQHEENIIYCENMIKKYKKDLITYYNLRLISLASYRSLHRLEKCFEIHNEFVHNKNIRNTTEWGYFLRLCEMYLERNKSIKFLSKSVKFFEKEKNYIQAGKSLISYAYILATQGKLKKAKKKIEKAEGYLSNKRMGSHMFLVNKAAIRLLSGDYSEEVWQILNESEITTVVPFDKLAIITNKLVWCIENRNSNRHVLLIRHAMELLKEEPDRHIHGLIYYNIYYLLKSRNEGNYDYYLEKANQMKPYCKPVKARLEHKPTTETRFILKKPWHVCFLAYWTYDLC